MYETTLIIIFITFIFGTYLVYKLYTKQRTYKIIEKFSLPTFNECEYYFVLKQNDKNNKIKVSVQKEVYDSYNLYDLIVIL